MTPSYIQFVPSRTTKRFLRGASAAVLASALMTSVSYAQDTAVDDDEDVVVATGIRQSLQNAQNIKRNADTFVDSITASDIGALPDRSVLEAIQRVPGVSISRFAAGDDPDHFSVEGSGVVIRGLSYVRSEFNGRDAFTANSGRALGFNDVPPELVGGVDVFKNQTADMIEGGISGVVNLRTLVPFDRSGRTISGTIEGTYTDLAEEFSPSGSALFSDRWDTKHGEFGFLASGSYSNLKSRSDGIQLGGLYPYNDTFNGPGDAGSIDGANNILAPAGVNVRTQEFDRDRIGVSVAGQWASNDGKTLATAQFIRSDSSNAWTEHTMQSEEDPGERAGFFARDGFTTTPLSGATNVCQTRDACGTLVPATGLFQSGVLSSDAAGWYGRPGIRMANATRVSDTDSVTSDYSFNVKYTPDDNWKFNFDAQYVRATTENQDISVFGAHTTDQVVDLNGVEINGSGSDPLLSYVEAPNSPFSSATDPASTYWRAAMDHFEDSEGDELAFRGDAQYDFNNDSFFKSVRFGYRFAERDQLTRWSNYNWGNISEAWKGGEDDFSEQGANTETFTYDNFRRGDVLSGNESFLFPSVGLASDYASLVNFLYTPGNFTNPDQHLRGFGGYDANGNVILLSGEDLYNDSEITDAVETTNAFYARVDFGAEEVNGLGGVSIDGNYGVRVVHTKLETEGAGQYQLDSRCNDGMSILDAGAAAACDVLSQPAFDLAASVDRTDILPSFNLKVGLTDELVMRFAAARAMSRPDVGSLRAFRTTRGDFTSTPSVPGDESSPSSVSFNRYIVNGGNPGLQPVLSTNLDGSMEYYFSDVGSFTASVFYKKLENIIVQADAPGGDIGGPVVAGANYNGPINQGDGSLKGFELAYQQFYDFLPGWASGFGMQANYTYVDQDSIPQSTVSSVRSTGVQDFDDSFTPGDLENLSKHTFNIVGLYESDKVEARLAYNWRSEFLLTTLDVITRLPIYNESTGQLDASLKYQFTDEFQLGLQGVNLLSEVTETSGQFNPEGDRFLRSRFENDRRISLVGSFTF